MSVEVLALILAGVCLLMAVAIVMLNASVRKLTNWYWTLEHDIGRVREDQRKLNDICMDRKVVPYE